MKKNDYKIFGYIVGLSISSMLLSGCNDDTYTSRSDSSYVYDNSTEDIDTTFEDEDDDYDEDDYDESDLEDDILDEDVEEIEIPEVLKEQIKKKLNYDGVITSDELDKLTTLELNLDDSVDQLKFLKYCTNLESLSLSVLDNNSIDESIYNEINGYQLLSLKELKLNDVNMIFNSNYSFIKKIQSLETLTLENFYEIDPDFLYSLRNIKKLSFKPSATTWLDYSELDFLDSINFIDGTKPYDVAIYLSNSSLKHLREKGTVVYIDGDKVNELMDSNYYLDSMLNEIGIDDYADRIENLNKIVCYIMDNYTYTNETEIDTNKFYDDGFLSSVFSDDEIICGNYAALTAALLNRVGIVTHIMYSSDHAWNLIVLKNTDIKHFNGLKSKYVYLDVTSADAIDEYVGSIDNEEFRWGLTNPINDDSHIALNFPSYYDEAELNNLSYKSSNEKVYKKY